MTVKKYILSWITERLYLLHHSFRPRVQHRCFADGAGLLPAAVDVPAHDQARGGALNGIADGGAAERASAGVAVNGALGGRMRNEHRVVRAVSEKIRGLLFGEVPAPCAERGYGDAAANSVERDVLDRGAASVQYVRGGPVGTGVAQFLGALGVAGDEHSGRVDVGENADGAIQAAPHIAEVARAHDDVGIVGLLDERLGGAVVRVNVAEAE